MLKLVHPKRNVLQMQYILLIFLQLQHHSRWHCILGGDWHDSSPIRKYIKLTFLLKKCPCKCGYWWKIRKAFKLEEFPSWIFPTSYWIFHGKFLKVLKCFRSNVIFLQCKILEVSPGDVFNYIKTLCKC